MPKLINIEKTQCEHVPRPSTSLIKAVLFSPVDPWEKPWLQPVLKMLRNRLPANSQMHNWSQKSLCVIWSSFLSVQLSANWIVQQQWTACFLSQTEPGCSHATQRHFPHTAPRRHLNWEASMSASPDGWISHIWSMPVFTSRGNSYSYLRLEIRGWTGLANPPSKGWRSATAGCCLQGRHAHKQKVKHSQPEVIPSVQFTWAARLWTEAWLFQFMLSFGSGDAQSQMWTCVYIYINTNFVLLTFQEISF